MLPEDFKAEQNVTITTSQNDGDSAAFNVPKIAVSQLEVDSHQDEKSKKLTLAL